MVEAGAGTGKTGVMVDRYCRLVCDEGVPLDAILTITFTEKAAAELRQRIRAELLRRSGSTGRELIAELGSAWITTIHGFCHRLLASHPVAAGVDPRFRVLDAAEADRAAREAFDEALELFLADGEAAARLETVAAYRIDALRGMVLGAHEELRSRGESQPALPDPPEPDVEAAIADAKRIAIETLESLGEKSRDRPLVERALERLRRAEGSAWDLDELVALRSRGSAKDDGSPTGRRRGGDRPGRRGRRRGAPPTVTPRACSSSSPSASRRSRSGAAGSTSRTCSCSPRACSSAPRSAAPTGPGSST